MRGAAGTHRSPEVGPRNRLRSGAQGRRQGAPLALGLSTSSQGAMRPITSFRCPMVDSSWKSRGNVSVHSANSWSSLGPNFRTRACKGSHCASTPGEGCLEAPPHQPLRQPRTPHTPRWGWAIPAAPLVAKGGMPGAFSVSGQREATQGWGLDHRGTKGDRRTFGAGPSVVFACWASRLPLCGDNISVCFGGFRPPHSKPLGFRGQLTAPQPPWQGSRSVLANKNMVHPPSCTVTGSRMGMLPKLNH